MKKVLQAFQAAHAVAIVEAASYGARASNICEGETFESYVEPSELWKDTLSSMRAQKTLREVLLRTASTTREATGWNDPIVTSSVHAYIAKSQHEALVEKKRRRDDVEEGTSAKRQTRLEKSRQESLPPDIVMDEVQKQAEKGKGSMKEKSKGPSYKLQSDIEASTDLKGIFEEQILNSKVEFTLRQILGIAKRKFHDVIIDAIKRKRHLTGESTEVVAHVIDSVVSREEEKEIVTCFQLNSGKKEKQCALQLRVGFRTLSTVICSFLLDWHILITSLCISRTSILKGFVKVPKYGTVGGDPQVQDWPSHSNWIIRMEVGQVPV
ncbi:hypothetical protein R1sor_025809 [Riccia sorocarpa]|uniref:DUF4100 domain-containing protein n=1 Tax=Riccia sorocarpa TaxID=122646 RepID=A0ABD3GB18_9MARC